MARYNEITNTFSAGELSPKVHNRTDTPEYKAGLDTMQNFIPVTSGGAFRRMGTEYLHDLTCFEGKAISYEEEDIDFATNGLPAFPTAFNITSNLIDPTTDLITTTAAHGFATGDRVKLREINRPPLVPSGITPPTPLAYDAVYYVIFVSATTFRVATTRANALGGTFIDITGPQSLQTDTWTKSFDLVVNVDYTPGEIRPVKVVMKDPTKLPPAPLVNGETYWIIADTVNDVVGFASSEVQAALSTTDITLTAPATGDFCLIPCSDAYNSDDVITIPFRGVLEDYYIVIKVPRDSLRNYKLGTTVPTTLQNELDTLPIRIFSRNFNSTARPDQFFLPIGYEQNITYQTVAETAFPELMPNFFFTDEDDRLTVEGFRYVQFGDDIILAHSSAKFAPMIIRLESLSPEGQATFNIQGLLCKPSEFATDSTESYTYTARAMPFQPQNLDTNIRYRIKTASVAGTPIKEVQPTPVQTTIEAVDDSGTYIAGHFTSADIGSLLQIADTTVSEGIFSINSLGFLGADLSAPAGSQVIVDIVVAATTDLILTSSFRWSRSSFSNLSGFPRALGFYQSRLHLASTLDQPVNIWASGIFDITLLRDRVLNQDLTSDVSKIDMEGPYSAEYSFEHQLKSKTISGINWLIDDDDILRAGTPENDFIIGFNREGAEGYGRDNKEARPQSGINTSSVQPVFADGKVLYLSLDGARIRSIDSKSRDVKYINLDLSALADHMRYQPKDTITSSVNVNSTAFIQFLWQEDIATLWCINSRNHLVGFTLEASQGVAAWHQHPLGGTASVLSVASAFNSSSRHQDLILIVSRTINGAAKTYVESIGENFNHPLLNTAATDARDSEDKPRYTDCFVKVNQASSTTVSGLQHLNGETVSAFYEGNYQEGLVVSAGTITISVPAEEILVGYKYNSRLKTLNLDRGQQLGSSRGNISRVDRVTISLFNSSTGRLSDEEESFNDIELTENELFSGDIKHELSQSPDREPRIIIETDKPLPLNVLGITTRGISYDG